MFTGIIEATGTVRHTREQGDTRVIVFDAPSIATGLKAGDSVAVDGACLTVEEHDPRGFSVTAVGTTLSRTVAGGYEAGSVVNLERALAMGDRLDGHLVQGHVDGLGSLETIRELDEYWKLDFRIPAGIWRATVLHGSIAINGISLTVNSLEEPDRCQVAIIPLTWERTNLQHLTVGARVNIEGDLIGKYVGRMLAPHEASWPTGSTRVADSGNPKESGS